MYVVLYGEKGDTGKLHLGKAFKQGSLMKFTLKAMDVGEITMMKVFHLTIRKRGAETVLPSQ